MNKFRMSKNSHGKLSENHGSFNNLGFYELIGF